MAEKRKRRSPAYKLLEHVWENEGHKQERSWDRLNHSMYAALKLAITSLMRFDRDDFEKIAQDFRIGYWGGNERHMCGENFYTAACAGTYGQNMSACLSFEQWKQRKPFLVLRSQSENVKVRVHIGASFEWPDWKTKVMRRLCVTSFSEDATYFTAVQREWDSGRQKVKKRFNINHEQIAEYHAKLKELKEPKP